MRSELILLVVALFGLVAAGPTGRNPANSCNIKATNLKTVDDLARLVKEASAEGSGCEPTVLKALTDMKAIVDDTTPCTMQKADAITSFVDT